MKFHVIEDHKTCDQITSDRKCDKIVLYTFYSPLVDVQTNTGYNFDKQELIYYLLYLFI